MQYATQDGGWPLSYLFEDSRKFAGKFHVRHEPPAEGCGVGWLVGRVIRGRKWLAGRGFPAKETDDEVGCDATGSYWNRPNAPTSFSTRPTCLLPPTAKPIVFESQDGVRLWTNHHPPSTPTWSTTRHPPSVSPYYHPPQSTTPPLIALSPRSTNQCSPVRSRDRARFHADG